MHTGLAARTFFVPSNVQRLKKIFQQDNYQFQHQQQTKTKTKKKQKKPYCEILNKFPLTLHVTALPLSPSACGEVIQPPLICTTNKHNQRMLYLYSSGTEMLLRGIHYVILNKGT
jgi:hypothetical protein